ncbi:MAG TPA: DUF5709 domain-containing protein [Actinomycetales bacterium]|nr:DUF5709 domain-containing protein [Actinomycetales bacterium]
MSEDTPGTRPDPEGIADGDSNQLPKEDTLIKRGVDDLLDEGYSPPERPSPSLKETAAEQNEPDTIAEREKQLTPEVWEEPPPSDPDRSGRITAPEDEATGHEQDVATEEVGVAGGAASAEEAAVHYESDPVEETATIEPYEVDEDDEGAGEQ